ncbi:MAG: TVP38/TMEM64 family protein [Acidobacteriota bacterium]
MKAKTAWILALVGLGVVLWQWAAHAREILAFAQAWAEASKGFVREYPAACWLGILALGAVAINCPLPLAALVKVLSGYFFGTSWGFTLNVSLSCAGGLLGFVAVRHLFYHALYSRFSRQLARANLEIARNGFWFVLSARLIMATPFFMVNVLAGLSCIRKRKFLLGTFLGVLPSSMIYAVSGSRLETFRSLSDLADPQFALALSLLGLAATIPALVRHSKTKRP